MQTGILRVDITLFFLTFVCLERIVLLIKGFLSDFVFTLEFHSPHNPRCQKHTILMTHFILNNCIYLSLYEIRDLWFQESKIPIVLSSFSYPGGWLLNLLQFASLLMGDGKDGHTHNILLMQSHKCLLEGRITSLTMLTTLTVATKHRDSFYLTILTHIQHAIHQDYQTIF